AKLKDRGHRVAGRQRGELFDLDDHERVGGNDERAGASLKQVCESGPSRLRCWRAGHEVGPRERELPPAGLSTAACALGLVGLTSTAIIVAVGSNSRTSSRRLGPTSDANVVTPVRLPPGRLRLATTPILIGSSPMTKTIGILEVVALAASTAGVPSAAITVT